MPPTSTLLNTPSHTEGMGSPVPTFPHNRALAHPGDWQIEVSMLLSIWVENLLEMENTHCAKASFQSLCCLSSLNVRGQNKTRTWDQGRLFSFLS